MNIRRDSETVKKYLGDESNAFWAQEDTVRSVYYPESEEDVRNIVEEANRTKTLCTISGTGTSITGSRVPLYGGIIISMENMLKPRENEDLEKVTHQSDLGEVSFLLDRENLEAHLPAGIPLEVLIKTLPGGLFYPPDPTEKSALIGSTVATNASGARSFYYGATREWIKGVRIVLGNGDLLTVKRGEVLADDSGRLEFNSDSGTKYSFKRPSYKMPLVKNAAGLYTKANMDLVDLFIGSEGILGIITEINAKLEQLPNNILGNIAFFQSEPKALNYAGQLRPLKHKGVLSIEYFDENSLAFIREKYSVVKAGYKAAVFVEICRPNETIMDLLMDLLEEHNAKDDWCADNEKEISKQKDFRHGLPEAINSYLKQHQSYKLGTDFVVPIDRFPLMMQCYRKTGESFKQRFLRDGVHYVLFGHIGDCHAHFNFVTNSERELKLAKQLYVELAQKAVSLGGTVSGEHGVGKKVVQVEGQDIPYLRLMYDEMALREIIRIKRMFDPNLILNVGNMVPREFF